MQIGIIGLGLIGGSIYKKLSEFGHELIVVTRNKSTLEKVKNDGVVCSCDYSVLKDCDVVFVCTPIENTLETLDRLEGVVSENCTVTDVASVKKFVTEKKRPYKFIPSHPMAGTENSGYDASFAELFQGAKWVLTPYDCQDFEKLVELIKQTGATPIIADANEHDKAVALISHMPMLISQALFHSAKDNKLAMKLASSGFRDTTRLAMSDLKLAKNMLSFNAENITKSLEDFQKSLKTLQNDYSDEVLSDIKNDRKKMYSPEGKNIL